MGVSFFEAMRGQVVDRWGRAHPFDFEVQAAGGLRRFLRTGEAQLTGVVKAPPWVALAPATGTIRIRPFVGRRIDYDITFLDEDERPFRFFGHKNLRKRNPMAGMTELSGELRQGAALLGTASLRFVLDDLAAFSASWSATSGKPSISLHPDPPDRALIEAFARAVIPAGEHVPAVSAETVDRTLSLIGQFPPGIADAFPVALRALDAVSRVRFGVGLAQLPPDRAAQIVETYADQRTLHLISAPIRTAHFHRADYLNSIGCPTFVQPIRAEPEPRWMSQVTTPAELPAYSELEAEVVIVGTGAGGAAAAAALAEAGVAVAIVEAGAFHTRSDHSGEPSDRMAHLYRDGGLTFGVGNTAISIPVGKTVGGTTRVNSGTCFKTPDAVVEEWNRELGLDFDLDAFGTLLDEVERELGVAPNEPRYLGKIATVVAKGADEMGLKHGPLPRNAPGCDGQGACVLGCPTQAKRSADVSWIPRALDANAALFTGLRVSELIRSGRKIIGVRAKGTDASGAEHELVIRAEAVILACGSLITPPLLEQNGLGNAWVGKNLSIHPGFGVQARFDEPMNSWNAVPQGYGVHSLSEEGIRIEGFWMPPQLAPLQTPLVGSELTRWMDAQPNIAHFGFMIRDQGVGHVRQGAGGRPLIRYDLQPSSVAMLKKGAATVSEILIRGGAREVLVGTGNVTFVRTIEEARALADADFTARDFQLLGAHPLGTCRVSASPEEGACDPSHRLYGTDNLYVMDGSSVPTSLGVNPQITIMAMALRAARTLAKQFDG